MGGAGFFGKSKFVCKILQFVCQFFNFNMFGLNIVQWFAKCTDKQTAISFFAFIGIRHLPDIRKNNFFLVLAMDK